VGLAVIHPPVLALPCGQWVDNRGQRGGKIGAGARLAQRPHDLPWSHHTRGAPGPYPLPEVRVLTLRRFPWGKRRRWGLPWPHRPPSFFLGADDDTTVREAAEGLEIEGANSGRFRLTVRSVAVEPIDTTRRLEVCCLPNAPEA